MKSVYFDVVIAGGSVAGLICAREIASNNHSVLVIEEDYEIGTPEHCGGLVSTAGLEELGIVPFRKTFDHLIESAEIYAPNGNSFSINSKKQRVAEISRRELDKQIAHQAQKNGAIIKVRTSFQELTDKGARTTEGEIYSSGMGGLYAGQAISKFLESKDMLDLEEYQKRWTEKFGKEFEKQLFARKILERLDNNTINKLFESVTPEITKEISEKDDFDFHTGSIIKLLGIKGSLKTAQAIISGEFKKLLS